MDNNLDGLTSTRAWRVRQAIKILARDIRRILALRDQVVRDGMQGPLGLTLCHKELDVSLVVSPVSSCLL